MARWNRIRKAFLQWRRGVFGKDSDGMFLRGVSGQIALGASSVFESVSRMSEASRFMELSLRRKSEKAHARGLPSPSFANAVQMAPPSEPMPPRGLFSGAALSFQQPPIQQQPTHNHPANPLWQQQFIVSTRHEFLLKQAFFLKWKRKAQRVELDRRNELRKLSLASHHYLIHIKLMAFRRWQHYIQHVHQKQKNNEKAYVFLYTSTLKKAFSGWTAYIRLKKKSKEQKVVADDFYYTHLLRDSFRHFWFLLQELGVHREHSARADQFHLFCLKKQSMEAFKHLIWLKARRVRDAALVDEFREASVPRLYFRSWRSALKRRIQTRKEHKNAVATDFFDTNLLRHTLRVWINVKKQQRERRRLKVLADEFWMRHHAPHILHLLSEHAQMRRMLREMEIAADEFSESRVKRRFMQRLMNAYLQRQKNQSQKQLASQFHESSIKKKFFMSWINKINEIIETENQLENAREYYDVRLMFNAVQAWKKYVDVRYVHREDKRLADQHYGRVLQRRYLNQWLHRLDEKNAEYAQWDRSVQYHNRQIMSQCWGGWMQYVHYRRAKNQILEKTVQNIRARLNETKRGRLFRAWHDWYERRVQKRINESRATSHWRQKMFGRAWISWQRHVFTQQLHRANKNLAQKHYEQHLVQSAFETLHYLFQEAQHEHKREDEATNYFFHILMRKSFDTWKSYIAEKRAYESRKSEALDMRRDFLKDFALRRMAAATRPHREERLPFLRNPEIPHETLHTYELMVKTFRRWRLKLQQKQKFPSWKVPRRGRPKVSFEEQALDFSEQMRRIDPSPVVDELLMNPLERPRPRLPVTLLMDTVRDQQPGSSSARDLLQSSTASTHGGAHSDATGDASILKRYGIPSLATKENVPPSPPSPLGERQRNEEIFHPNLSSTDIHNDISLGDLQDHTIQYPSFVTERHALADTSLLNNQSNARRGGAHADRVAEYDKLQQQIAQIQEALGRILPLKKKYQEDQKTLLQLRQEMEEFPFEKEESKEYASMEQKEKVLQQSMDRFQQLREKKLPQLQQVLQKKIRQMREMAEKSDEK